MKYSYYHFGPYSSGLQAKVQDMVDKTCAAFILQFLDQWSL